FALHEDTLVMAMLLQHFELIVYQNYQLDVKQTLTLKHGDFKTMILPRKQTNSYPPVLAPPEDKLKNDEINQHVQKRNSIMWSCNHSL
ncbi:hypothetical protein FO504_29220, partial [Bacillus cereus]|uniref:hypothetical protein n=1 Tax=Bacillus cereus TaxID=1396 RepID=UPI0028403656